MLEFTWQPVLLLLSCSKPCRLLNQIERITLPPERSQVYHVSSLQAVREVCFSPRGRGYPLFLRPRLPGPLPVPSFSSLDWVSVCKRQWKRKTDTVILFIQGETIHQNKEYNTRHVHVVDNLEYDMKLRESSTRTLWKRPIFVRTFFLNDTVCHVGGDSFISFCVWQRAS